jgi:succinate dehydrogenase / fumarate reductase iron-sulfur subunit
MATSTMKLKLHVWRQASPAAKGGFVAYEADANEHMSFLEMLDVLNERLESQGEEPIVFDHDCREGICGTCGMVINGRPHGPWERTTVCQLHMREYNDGDQVWIEPWRAKGFPVLRDLFVDRSALDRIVQAGGFVSANCGGAPDANAIPVNRDAAEASMDAASCIGCGACVAACPNASAMLFTGAKISHMNRLPQGQPERYERALDMVLQMEAEAFGSCSNHGACENACPKGIALDVIGMLNRDYMAAVLKAG